MLPYLKENGTVVLNTHPIMPVTATLAGETYNGWEMVEYLQKHTKQLFILDADAGCRKIGSPKVLNMIMLGAALRQKVLPFSLEEIEETMRRTVKPQFAELNSKALRYE